MAKHFERSKNATELWIDVTREFITLKSSRGYIKWEIVTLYHDDGTDCPKFRNKNWETKYILWFNLTYKKEAFKNGEMVYVSDKSVEDALKNKRELSFIWTNIRGGFMCDDSYSYPNSWKYIAKIPKEEPIEELTHEEVEKLVGRRFKLITK